MGVLGKQRRFVGAHKRDIERVHSRACYAPWAVKPLYSYCPFVMFMMDAHARCSRSQPLRTRTKMKTMFVRYASQSVPQVRVHRCCHASAVSHFNSFLASSMLHVRNYLVFSASVILMATMMTMIPGTHVVS